MTETETCNKIDLKNIGNIHPDDNIFKNALNKLPINYMTCGKYFFDGKFFVVEFPDNYILYHGSNILPFSNHDIPSNVPSWFSSYNYSSLYGKIFSYSFKSKKKFIILDNDYNIKLFFHHPSLSHVKKDLKVMFGIDDENDYNLSKNMHDGYISYKKKRTSYYRQDGNFTRAFCNVFLNNSDEYAGLVANDQMEIGRTRLVLNFHLEFIICHPPDLFIRNNFTDNKDIAYFDFLKIEKDVSEYFRLLKNVKFKENTALHLTVWTLFFIELLAEYYSEYIDIKPTDLCRMSLLFYCSFLTISIKTIDSLTFKESKKIILHKKNIHVNKVLKYLNLNSKDLTYIVDKLQHLEDFYNMPENSKNITDCKHKDKALNTKNLLLLSLFYAEYVGMNISFFINYKEEKKIHSNITEIKILKLQSIKNVINLPVNSSLNNDKKILQLKNTKSFEEIREAMLKYIYKQFRL
jgi:hypothetical protein